MENNIFSNKWVDKIWTDWISLGAGRKEFSVISNQKGFYRIRAMGQSELIYIGQTGRGLRERLNALRSKLNEYEMPWNDPHTAAPNLWAWKQEENFQYECSVTESDLGYNERQVFEDFLLWTHRKETGRSTLCNYGRFHSSYKKSTNRKKGIRGYKLPKGEQNPSGLSSSTPLNNIGKPLEKKWMGLEWSKFFGESSVDISTMPNKPALYRILNESNDEIVYIGETLKLRSRWKGHLRSKRIKNNSYCVSFFLLNEQIPKHHLHELETDLVGNFYSFYKKPPQHQYKQTK